MRSPPAAGGHCRHATSGPRSRDAEPSECGACPQLVTRRWTLVSTGVCGIEGGVARKSHLAAASFYLSFQRDAKIRMAPRVGFEPTTNRLTVDCSTTELPRNIRAVRRPSRRGLYQVRRQGERPSAHPFLDRFTTSQRKRGPLSGPSKALGMVGCLQGKTR